MSDTYTQLEQLFKAKNWQGCINLIQSPPCDLTNLDDTQQKNHLWWTGQAYRHLSQYENSKNQFHALINKFPDNHLGFEGLINIAQQQKDWKAVIEQSLEFQTKFPSLWHSYWWLGQAYLNTKEYDKAEQWFGLLAQKFPKRHHGIFGLAETAYHAKNWELAIERNLKLQNEFPNLWQGYWWAGQAYKNICEYEKAEEQFLIIQEKFPNSHLGYEGMVDVAQHQQNKPLVIERAMIFQNKFPNLWHGYWWLGQTYKELYQYEKSEEWFRLFQKNLPNDHRGYEGLIFIPQHKQDWQETINQSLIFQTKFPNMWQGYWWTGQAYKNIRNYDKAEEQFLIIQEKFPNSHLGYEGMVDVAQHQQNKPLVIERAMIFQNKFPNLWHGYWWLGQTHKELYQYDKAEEQFLQLQERLPNDHRGYEGMVNIAQHQQNWQQTIAKSLEFQSKFPNMWQGYWWAGQAYKTTFDYDKAEHYFTQLTIKHPTIHHGYGELFSFANKKQQYEKMLDLALQFQKNAPSLWHGYSWAGQAYQLLKDFSQAKKQFEIAISVDKNQTKPYELLMELPNISNDTRLEIIEKYKNQFPKRYFNYKKYHHIASLEKNIEKLEKELKSRLVNQNNNIHLLLLLVNFYCHIKNEQKFKQSIKTLKNYPEHHLYWQAKYCYQYKNYTKSQRILYKLIHEYPTYIQGYELLLDVLKIQNNQSKLLKLHNICKNIFYGLYHGFSYSNGENSFIKIQNHYLDYIIRFIEPIEISEHHKNIQSLYCINYALQTYHNDYDLQYRKIELLLLTNRLLEAEYHFIKFKKDKHPSRRLDTLEHRLHSYKKNYKKLHELCIKFSQKYPEYARNVLFPNIKSLNFLGQNQKIHNVYKNFIKDKRSHNQACYVSENTIDLHSNILSGYYADTEKAIVSPKKELQIPERSFVKIIENDINYPVLYICFSGLLNGNLVKNYPEYDIDNIIGKFLSSQKEINKSEFPYLGFAKQSKNANFIIFKDIFRTSHLANLEQSLSIIKNQINYFNPKYIVCTGASAGGFASIAIGNMIKANLIFSFAPRHPFIMNFDNYPKAIQEHYNITNPDIIDIAQLQKSNHGFVSKTYITLCEYNDCDIISVQNLDIQDKNLSITYCHGSNHAIQEQLGTKSVFKEMERIVALEIHNNFNLPMQRDFLANLTAFKYNSLRHYPK